MPAAAAVVVFVAMVINLPAYLSIFVVAVFLASAFACPPPPPPTLSESVVVCA